jgi:hypothetical protein
MESFLGVELSYQGVKDCCLFIPSLELLSSEEGPHLQQQNRCSAITGGAL